MSAYFGTAYWLDDYWGPYFQPEAGGGVIIGTLAGSAAGVATVTGTLEQPATEAPAIAATVGGVKPEDVARIRRFLKREKEPITKLYKKLVRIKRYVPDENKAELVKIGEQYSTDAKPLTLDWLNFEAIMKAGDQARMHTMINNAILAAEIARAEDDEDDEDILLLLYA